MAMLPFCGYNMADYFGHWLRIGREHDPQNLPRIFLVNWFRKGNDGEFLWPGFGENIRVLEWIFRRCDGGGVAAETPTGRVPPEGAINTRGIDVDIDALLATDVDEVRSQLPQVEAHLAQFGERLPGELRAQLDALKSRLG